MTKTDVFSCILQKAKNIKDKKIGFVECEDARIIECVKRIIRTKLCTPVLVGERKTIEKSFSPQELNKILIFDPCEANVVLNNLIDKLYELRKNKGLSYDESKQLLKKPMYYATMLLKDNIIDGIVAGAVLHSADVMRPAFQIIKQKPEISKVSSCFVVEVPQGRPFGENGLLIFADCAVVEYPTAEELASIAISSAETAKSICGINPKVAFLSYSSNSGDDRNEDQSIAKIKEAKKIVCTKNKKIICDGEIQADAALIKSVQERKFPESKIHGDANVLIFPDINASNISYKLVQHIAGVRAVGPILQGLNLPINDLSRGASVEEIYLVTAITILQI